MKLWRRFRRCCHRRRRPTKGWTSWGRKIDAPPSSGASESARLDACTTQLSTKPGTRAGLFREDCAIPPYCGPITSVPWDAARWPNFTPAEIACRCCGEVCVWPEALDALERLRRLADAPIILNSAHRCALHNARVGGAPLSMHKQLAFDVALSGHDLARLLSDARLSKFTGFGFGQTFLHLDVRERPARWFYGKRSEAKWISVLSSTRG